MRTARARSETGYNHVIVRGVGQQIIFEDDQDRSLFIARVVERVAANGGDLIAWCLMENHAHLLVRLDGEALSSMMRACLSSYALIFNERHGRSGHLFQDRFRSEAIDTDEYLMTVVRYIHQNPVKAGLCSHCGDYAWSSYGDYIHDCARGVSACNTSIVLELFGGREPFREFHECVARDKCLDIVSARKRMTDEEAIRWMRNELGFDSPSDIASLTKKLRNEMIVRMRRAGMTGKQIQRLTGIGRGIVDRARLSDAFEME